MNSFWNEHGTKILGGVTAVLGTLASLITAGSFEKLLTETSIGWMSIFVALSTAAVGGATMARGFNNSAQVKIAAAMETAIKSTPPQQSGFVSLQLLLIVMAIGAMLALSACVTSPHKVIEVACTSGTKYSVERCVKGIAETWETYQKRAELIVADPLTPPDLKKAVQAAEAASRPVVVDMLKAGAFYGQVKLDLAAGKTTADQLVIANARLEEWVAKALPLVRSFGDKMRR